MTVGKVAINRKPKTHYLKILPEYFNEVENLNKQFELRKDDRDYQVGDWLVLNEWKDGEYTGRQIGCLQIKYILRDCKEYGLMDGYCILVWGTEVKHLSCYGAYQYP